MTITFPAQDKTLTVPVHTGAIVVKDFGDRLVIQAVGSDGVYTEVGEVFRPVNDGLGENHPLATEIGSRRNDPGFALLMKNIEEARAESLQEQEACA